MKKVLNTLLVTNMVVKLSHYVYCFKKMIGYAKSFDENLKLLKAYNKVWDEELM